MGMVIRLYGILSTNPFKVFIKEGDTAYPLNTGFTQYNGTYQSDIHQIDLLSELFKNNTQYWIKLVDTITGRYIVENIHINDDIAYINCDETCEFSGIAEYVAPPPPTPPITPTPTPSSIPDIPIFGCGDLVSFSGESGTFVREIIFPPNSIGQITFTYNAHNIPDRFRIVYDSVEIINTYFVSSYYGVDQSMVDHYNDELDALGYPPIEGNNGYVLFNKTTTTSSMFVYVDAPLDGTSWDFTVSCSGVIAPTPTITPSSVTPTPTPTITSSSVTPTPTPTITQSSVTPTPTPTNTPTVSVSNHHLGVSTLFIHIPNINA